MNDESELKKNNQKFKCSFCNSSNLSLIINFENVALAGAFLKKEDFEHEEKFPLQVYFCNDCYMVQVVNKISPKKMFVNYFYKSSAIKTLKEHFKNYAREVSKRFLNPSESKVLEFGCNDGVLLRPLLEEKIKVIIGVDPAKNIISKIDKKGLNLINEFFNTISAKKIVNKFGKLDLIMANNVFAHIPDINDTTQAIKLSLKKDGVFIFEVHYLGNVLEKFQYDMIYHEHLYYYSLIALENHFRRFSMIIFDLKKIPIHGGSIRFYVTNNKSKYALQSKEVVNLRNLELQKNYDRFSTYNLFSSKIDNTKSELNKLLSKLKKNGSKIAGYGASGRANTILQFCDIDYKILDFMIDDAPTKIGYFTPGSHLEIFSSEILNQSDRPEYVVIFAWSFLEEIYKKNMSYLRQGGKFIIPLPEVKIYGLGDL